MIAFAILRGTFDLAGKRELVAKLERAAAAPEFWANHKRAQQHMRRLTQTRAVVQTWEGLLTRSDDLVQLFELAQGEGDAQMVEALESDLADLVRELAERELELQLAGANDARPAILAVNQGAGGVDAQDWSEMVLRMYLRWAEQSGYDAELLDYTPGDEAGLKSAAIRVDGEYPYGYLKSERGVHRLVRLSPFDSGNRRHTSFAGVEVYPEPEDAGEIEIDTNDLKFEAFRASGHGGQSVQKNSTAVRITHGPSGIVVSVQNERSQAQNRQVAMRILRARLNDLEQQRRAKEQAALKGEHVSAEFGNQVRSYVLHPYQMVKDHRTNHETSDAAAVLDGELQSFLQAYLRNTMSATGA